MPPNADFGVIEQTENGASIERRAVEAEVPRKVQVVDLSLLSQLAGCTKQELVEGLHYDKPSVDVAGAVIEPNKDPITSQSRRPCGKDSNRDSKASATDGYLTGDDSQSVVTFETTLRESENSKFSDLNEDVGDYDARDRRFLEHENEKAAAEKKNMWSSDSISSDGKGCKKTSFFSEDLEQCRDDGSTSTFLASASSFDGDTKPSLKEATLLLGIPPTTTDGRMHSYECHAQRRIRVSSVDGKREAFHGFLIGVEHIESSSELSMLDQDVQMHNSEAGKERHVLNDNADAIGAFAQKKQDRETPSSMDVPSEVKTDFHLACPAALSLPLPDQNCIPQEYERHIEPVSDEEQQSLVNTFDATNATDAKLQPPQDAFLIEMKANKEDPGRAYLAVPECNDEFLPLQRKESLLERTLSFALPSDVTHVEVQTVGSKNKVQMIVDRQTPLLGYVILVAALLAISSGGAALDMQTGVSSPFLKLYWRFSATSLGFAPMAAKSIIRDGMPQLSLKEYGEWLTCSACYCIFFGAFLISLEYTSIGDAFLLANSHSLFLVIGKVLFGFSVAFLEGSGAIVGMIGAILCSMDSQSDELDSQSDELCNGGVETTSQTGKGNIYAMISAIGGVGYLLLSKKLRPKVDLFVFMFVLLAFGSVLVFALMTYGINDGDYSFDANPTSGLWGWTNLAPDRLPLQLYLIFVCDLIGTTGYVAVMKYFDPLVVSVVMLLEPVIAVGMGIFVGVGNIPGPLTELGGSIVTIGTLMVIFSSSNRTDTYDIKRGLHLLTQRGRRKNDTTSGELNGKSKKKRSSFLRKNGRTTKKKEEDLDAKNDQNANYGSLEAVEKRTKKLFFATCDSKL